MERGYMYSIYVMGIITGALLYSSFEQLTGQSPAEALGIPHSLFTGILVGSITLTNALRMWYANRKRPSVK